MVEKKFTYSSQTEKYFTQLLEVAALEGLDKSAEAEFEALKLKLKPDIAKNIENNKADIVDLLSHEIIKRYYYQKGEIQFSLRTDSDLKLDIEKLNNVEDYKTVLSKK